MLLAKRGVPGIGVLLVTLVGGTLAAGSANTLNCYLDRDIDVVMHRTERRPLVTATIRPGEALVSGVALAVVSTLLLGFATNWLTAGLALGAICFLRLRLHARAQAAHAAEHRLGRRRGLHAGAHRLGRGHRSACRGRRWCLFAVIFFWTPPHFWALAMRFRDDYAAAGCRCCRWSPRTSGGLADRVSTAT